MSMVEWSTKPVEPSALVATLHRHKLLPLWMRQEAIAIGFAARTVHGAIYDGAGKDATCIALLFFSAGADPGVGVLTFIPTVKNPKDRKIRALMAKASEELRREWFEGAGLRRVECRIPVLRTRNISALKAIGFRAETTPRGMRNAENYGNGPEALALFSLIPGDFPPPPEFDLSEDAQQGVDMNPEPELVHAGSPDEG